MQHYRSRVTRGLRVQHISYTFWFIGKEVRIYILSVYTDTLCFSRRHNSKFYGFSKIREPMFSFFTRSLMYIQSSFTRFFWTVRIIFLRDFLEYTRFFKNILYKNEIYLLHALCCAKHGNTMCIMPLRWYFGFWTLTSPLLFS
jgi:hypothetical protein